MKAILLNGEVDENRTLRLVLQMLADDLTAAGFELEVFELRKLDIAPCQGCFGCWLRSPGECLIEDASKDVVRALVRADLLIFLTPVTFGGYSSELKKVLDRAICFVSPFFVKIQGRTHHRARYERSPRLLGLGITKNMDSESAELFESLVERNAVNFHAPSHAATVVDGNNSSETIRSKVLGALAELETLS